MKIVILNGSPRKGNTLAAAKAFAEGAAGNEIEIIDTYKLNIGPCRACGACGCEKGCVARDDTNPTIDKLAAADVIIYATPVYWWGMTAQLKLVLDKTYCRAAGMKGKKIGVIVIGAAETTDPEYELISGQFKCIADYLNWEILFSKVYSAGDASDLAGNAAVLEELKEEGAKLA